MLTSLRLDLRDYTLCKAETLAVKRAAQPLGVTFDNVGLLISDKTSGVRGQSPRFPSIKQGHQREAVLGQAMRQFPVNLRRLLLDIMG